MEVENINSKDKVKGPRLATVSEIVKQRVNAWYILTEDNEKQYI